MVKSKLAHQSHENRGEFPEIYISRIIFLKLIIKSETIIYW